MAIEYVGNTYHSRAKGHSAVGGAAYRSGMCLYDQRYDKTHDFSRKINISYNEIMLPEGASSLFLNREYLWNKVEEAEKRKNSQVAKENILALPIELKRKDWIELAKRFAYNEYVKHGLVADIAIHNKNGNPHAHITVTTRVLYGESFSKKKAREILDPEIKTGKNGIFVSEKNGYNEKWRKLQNEYFHEKNLDVVVDQNYLIAQRHEGRVTADKVHYLKAINALKYAQSKDIVVNNPEGALAILALRNSVISIKDIESIAYKHSESKEEYLAIRNNLISSSKLYKIGLGIDGFQRYTTADAVNEEISILYSINKLKEQSNHNVSKHHVDTVISRYTLSNEQEEAVKYLITSNDIALVQGRPGTGKTYMLKAAREIWEKGGYKVVGTAVAGIARKGLSDEAGMKSYTVRGLNYFYSKGNKLGDKAIIVVDEAGMIDRSQTRELINNAKTDGAKIVFIGDPDQLQPVGAGTPLDILKEEIGCVQLNEIRRQEVEWQRQASIKLSLHDFDGIDDYYNEGKISFSETSEEAYADVVSSYVKYADTDNIGERVIAAHRNYDVNILNDLARCALIQKGLLGGDKYLIDTECGTEEFCNGDKILFTKNFSENKDVTNGTFGKILKYDYESGELTVELKNNKSAVIDTKTYNSFTYGYAATVHKLQGSTVDYTYVYAGGKYWNRNLSLVAMTRHKKDIKVFTDKETFKNYSEFKKAFSRETYKDNVLNYPVAFALRNGIESESISKDAVNFLNVLKEDVKDKWLWLYNKQTAIEKENARIRLKQLQKESRTALYLANYIKFNKQVNSYARAIYSSYQKSDLEKKPVYFKYKKIAFKRNKYADFIYRHGEKFAESLTANNMTLGDVSSYAMKYRKEKAIKVIFDAYLDKNEHKFKNLAIDLYLDGKGIDNYSKLINHYSKVHYLEVKDVINMLNKHGKQAYVINNSLQIHIENANAYIKDPVGKSSYYEKLNKQIRNIVAVLKENKELLKQKKIAKNYDVCTKLYEEYIHIYKQINKVRGVDNGIQR